MEKRTLGSLKLRLAVIVCAAGFFFLTTPTRQIGAANVAKQAASFGADHHNSNH
jgi:hypothetical protein